MVSPTFYHSHYVHYSTITRSQTTPKFLSGDWTVPIKPGPLIYYIHCFCTNSTLTTQASTFTPCSTHLLHPLWCDVISALRSINKLTVLPGHPLISLSPHVELNTPGMTINHKPHATNTPASACHHTPNGSGSCQFSHHPITHTYRGADKSLARPGSKQANVSVTTMWISFSALPCREKKLDDSSRLDVVEMAHVPDVLPSLFPFLVGLKTYHHPGIYVLPCSYSFWTDRPLTLILLTWRIRWAPNNASKWQMGFNSAFKGLRRATILQHIK